MKEIAFFPLTPLGDAIVTMGQLKELHRLYAPCRVTVFAIPLIAELYGNYSFCDKAVELDGGVRGSVRFREVPKEHFDVVFNHGYQESWTQMLRQMDYSEAYGMEELFRSKEECEVIFTKWVPLDYWNAVVLKKRRFVSQQMAEIIRFVNPDYENGCPQLDEQNYRCTRPNGLPDGKYALFLPGTTALVKYWPIQKYLQLAKMLDSQGITPLFVMGPQDMALRDAIRASGYSFYDNLSLSELAYCMVHSQIVLGNDMGPMHLAACLDVPTVHFFSFTGAHNWFQYDQKRHKLVMPECGRRDGTDCGSCVRSCIGKITLMQGYRACQELLGLPMATFRHIAYFAQDLIGDALVTINELEELSRLYSPCCITVFCTKTNASLFERYAFCDYVCEYEPGKWHADDLPQMEFEAVCNTRYDRDSVNMVQALRHRYAYGYENVKIPEALCREVYDAWLPLSMWDDEEFRRNTSVTEQSAALLRLVNPQYHRQYAQLALNTFVHEFFSASKLLLRNMALLIRGASSRYKDWGTENYLELARRLRERGLVPLFLLGPGEADYAKDITAAGFEWLAGLNFGEIAALMNAPTYTKCVIGNDTGLMHLACALDVPSVTIATDETRFIWFPYRSPRHLSCYPECSELGCSRGNCPDAFKHNCIERIPIGKVINAVEKLCGLTPP